MKVLVNGGLSLSELDGWWAEAYGADVGWALRDGRASVFQQVVTPGRLVERRAGIPSPIAACVFESSVTD